MELTEVERLIATEQRGKSNSRRIESLEKNFEVLNRIATSVEIIATKQEHMAEKVDTLTNKVNGVEKIPAGRWQLAINTCITGIVSAVVGAFVALLASGGM